MKLNFSIDFILGTCDKNKEETRQSNLHTGSNNSNCVTPRNFTVEWRPPLAQSSPKHYETVNQPMTSSAEMTQAVTSPQRVKTEQSTFASFHPYHNPFVTQQFGHFLPYPIPGQDFDVSNPKPVESRRVSKSPPSSYRRHYVRKQVASPTFLASQPTSPQHTSSSEESDVEARLGPEVNSQNISSEGKNDSADSVNSDPKGGKRSAGNRIGRRLFTGFQILELEKAFSAKPYLTRTERAFLAQKVNLTECQIKTWFQNRRTKEKRRGPGSEDDDVTSFDDVICNQPYQSKSVRIPGYGIQIRPTFGPPDKHLKAAIVDFLKRKSGEAISVK